MRTMIGMGLAVALAAFSFADSANAWQQRPMGPQFHGGPAMRPNFGPGPGIRPNFGPGPGFHQGFAPGFHPGFGPGFHPGGPGWVAQPPVYVDPPVVIEDPPPVLYQCGVDPDTGQIQYDGVCVPPSIPMDPGSD